MSSIDHPFPRFHAPLLIKLSSSSSAIEVSVTFRLWIITIFIMILGSFCDAKYSKHCLSASQPPSAPTFPEVLQQRNQLIAIVRRLQERLHRLKQQRQSQPLPEVLDRPPLRFRVLLPHHLLARHHEQTADNVPLDQQRLRELAHQLQQHVQRAVLRHLPQQLRCGSLASPSPTRQRALPENAGGQSHRVAALHVRRARQDRLGGAAAGQQASSRPYSPPKPPRLRVDDSTQST